MDGQMVSLADMASQNVFAQLSIDNPELAQEIIAVMDAEIRRVEIELSIMLTDLKKSFDDDIAALKAKGISLPEGHMLESLHV